MIAAATGFPGLLVMVGLAASAFGVIGLVRDSAPRRMARGRKIAAAIAVAGLFTASAGMALADPAVDDDGPIAASPAPTSLAPPPTSTSVTPTPTEPASTPASQAPSPSPSPPAPEQGTALYALAALKVKGRAQKTGYDRDLFGSGWTDTNHNSCTTREDILRRDLRPVTVLAGTDGCDVVKGTLADPYTGHKIKFADASATSGDVEIDHVVALSDAWQKGAQQWSRKKRVEFANDALELVATGAAVNAAKGDGDTATWLPPNKSYRCTYVARQISVKAHYGLWVTAAEKAAMARILATCSDQPVLSRSAAAKPKSPSAKVQEPKPTPKPEPESEPDPPADESEDPVYYANCTAVRAAGADPIHVGEPGYSRKLDRDGDGVACE